MSHNSNLSLESLKQDIIAQIHEETDYKKLQKIEQILINETVTFQRKAIDILRAPSTWIVLIIGLLIPIIIYILFILLSLSLEG